MIKGSIQEEDITIVNSYAPNIGAPQNIRQTITDIKGEIDSNTIIIGDFNTPLTPVDRSSKQKINKETQILYDTLDEMDLLDIFRMFPPKNTPSSQTHMGISPGLTTSCVTNRTSVNFSSVQSLSCVRFFATPWTV